LIPTLLRGLRPLDLLLRRRKPACRVLFVCMGNICRSPTAVAVFRRQVAEAGLGRRIECASAGTHGVYAGVLADGRARAAAERRGYDMSQMRGRVLRDEDFERYDLIVAMDRQNLEALQARCPAAHAGRLHLLMAFAGRPDVDEVPDPYYGTTQSFELALDLIEEACAALLAHVRARYLDATAAAAVDGR
jgi:protein-tyrosine phosphatase